MHKLLSIDPGYATGVSLWSVPDDEEIEREAYFLVSGGIDGFEEWWWSIASYFPDETILVCESFIQDGRTPKVESDALQIEGFLRGVYGVENITWQRNSMKNARNGDRLLKQHGLFLTGKQVGWKDGRDVNDSQLHALAWAKNNHAPSQEYFFPK